MGRERNRRVHKNQRRLLVITVYLGVLAIAFLEKRKMAAQGEDAPSFTSIALLLAVLFWLVLFLWGRRR